MILHVKTTARLAVRNMAVVNFFWDFSVYLRLKFDVGPQNLFLVQKFDLILIAS